MLKAWAKKLPLATLLGLLPGANCSVNATYLNLAAKMIESNVGRGQGLSSTGAVSAYIEQGVFQQSLRAAIDVTTNSTQKAQWEQYLSESTQSLVPLLSNATADAHLPLDRFSAGTSMILEYKKSGNSSYLPAIHALQQSAFLQLRNENGGLWYYENLANLTTYRNLSYLDGMYSYPAFAVLSQASSTSSRNRPFRDPLQQLQILHNHCVQTSGLLVHGYDGIMAHSWANPVTGASPNVWGRALAWYTVGLITMYQNERSARTRSQICTLFNTVVQPQIDAYQSSLRQTNTPGVWQVVDHPGQAQNFVEASASLLTAWALLAGARLGMLNAPLHDCAIEAGRNIYNYASQRFLIENANNTLSLNGTSSVASLGSGGNINYNYYVTRPVLLNSLFGTSGFILASVEMAQL